MRFASTSIIEEKNNYKSLNLPQTRTLQPNDTSNKLCNKRIHLCKKLPPMFQAIQQSQIPRKKQMIEHHTFGKLACVAKKMEKLLNTTLQCKNM
jgi:hypothetical protein